MVAGGYARACERQSATATTEVSDLAVAVTVVSGWRSLVVRWMWMTMADEW